jgi:hypothetical protein
MTSTYSASTVVDVVEAMPTLFGFAPTESFVAIVTSGPRNQFGFRMRLDMPDPSDVVEAAQMIAGHLNTHRQDGVVLVALTASQEVGDALMAGVVTYLSEAPVVLALRADDDHVWEHDRHGRPDYGAPVHDRHPVVSEAVVQAITEGQQIWSSREELAAMFVPAPVLQCVSDAAAFVATSGPEAGERLALSATAALEAAATGAIRDDQYRVLAVAAQVIPVRDAIWSTITRETAESDAEVWRQVAIKTAGSAAAGPYALAGFGYWLAGDGARALMATEQALKADPHHSMASLVNTVLAAAINPADWQGFPA